MPVSSLSDPGTREKGLSDFLSLALDLLRARVQFLALETRRAIGTSVLLSLVDKAGDRVLEAVVKVVAEMLHKHRDDVCSLFPRRRRCSSR